MDNENETVTVDETEPNTPDASYSWTDDVDGEEEEIIRLVKLQKMWTTDTFDELIHSKIEAARSDLFFVGIREIGDELYREAIITYCVMNLGIINPNEYDRLKRAYDEMRAQLQSKLIAYNYEKAQLRYELCSQ